jgi:germination protein M
MRRALLVVVLAVLAAGCGSSAGPTDETTTAASAPPERTKVVVYVVKDGKLAAERRLVPHTKAVARAALDELGFAVRSLAIDGGTATVELGTSPTDLERAQVVFTLTEFSSVKQVAIDGRTLNRTDEDLFAPPIVVVEPQPGDTVTSPVRVYGSADAFEATFQIDVVDHDGKLVAHRTVMATSGSGERGSYDVSIPFEGAAAGQGKIVAYEDSAENGERIHVVETPVVFS